MVEIEIGRHNEREDNMKKDGVQAGSEMRVKPREEWHNFDFTQERRLGELEIALSLNAVAARRFLVYLEDRVRRNTGIRFKFKAGAAQEIVHKEGRQYLSYQLFSKDDGYIFPNESAHTNRFDSPYNRVEFYIPMERIKGEENG